MEADDLLCARNGRSISLHPWKDKSESIRQPHPVLKPTFSYSGTFVTTIGIFSVCVMNLSSRAIAKFAIHGGVNPQSNNEFESHISLCKTLLFDGLGRVQGQAPAGFGLEHLMINPS
jgi:hypothetical protein